MFAAQVAGCRLLPRTCRCRPSLLEWIWHPSNPSGAAGTWGSGACCAALCCERPLGCVGCWQRAGPCVSGVGGCCCRQVCGVGIRVTTRKLAAQPPPPVNAHLSMHTCQHLHAAWRVLSYRSYISDITTSQCRQLLKKEAAGSLFDVVLHDGAPNVGGAWSSEAYTQVGVARRTATA